MTETWSQRAKRYGRRCTLGLAIADTDVDRITAEQAMILFPLLNERMDSRAAYALDYGCGYGRFAPLLSMFCDRLDAYDPCSDLLLLAPHVDDSVRLMTGAPETFLRHRREQYDLIWIVHVLGGIPEPEIDELSAKITLMLKPGGLLFLADNTSDPVKHYAAWTSRVEQTYLDLFSAIALAKVGSYVALDNPMSVFAGRRR